MGRQPLPPATVAGMKGWVGRYVAHNDPLVAGGNFVALVLGWNQPFYPVYLWFIVGADAWVDVPDVLSAVVFLAIPAIARRRPLLARVLLPLAATANIVLCMKLLGGGSGIWLFLFPCGMLAAGLFRWRERWIMLGLCLLPLAVWLLLKGRLGAAPVAFGDAQMASIFALNAVSALSLVAFLAWVQAGTRRDAATPEP